jgi:hypothetical protein
MANLNKRQENSFTITGSGALRNSPGDVLISAYTTVDVCNVESTSRPWKKGDQKKAICCYSLHNSLI